jgi:hypothetical protein
MAATPLHPALSVLRYWRDIEFFNPFDLDGVQEQYDHVVLIRSNEAIALPWEDRLAFELDPEFEYGFDLFIAPFSKSEVRRVLKTQFPAIEYELTQDPYELSGQSCLARLSLTDTGIVMWDDLGVSTMPWALSQLAAAKELSMQAFESFCDVLSLTIANANLESSPFTHAQLVEVTNSIAKLLPLHFAPENLLGLLVIQKLRKRKLTQEGEERELDVAERALSDKQLASKLRNKRKVDILNSFYLRDLEKAYENIPNSAASALSELLSFNAEAHTRTELFSQAGQRALQELLQEKHIPAGRWPSPSAQKPAAHQQAVVNRFFTDEAKLQAVNGPPGTGKTALVRDIIAALVVKRARVLANLKKPADAFMPGWERIQLGKKTYQTRILRPELRGYEIVVCSNNNAAVENISKELPRIQALGSEFSETLFMPEFARMLEKVRLENSAKKVKQEDAVVWGVPSIALGNAKNRYLFRKAAFLAYRDENEQARSTRMEQERAQTFLEWREHASQSTYSFSSAKDSFRQVLNVWESRRPRTTSVETFSDFEAPCITEEDNRLRSQLFIEALKLHEAWARETPQLEKDCFLLSALLGNPQAMAPNDAEKIWPLLFMIVPVVSSTLASVERMFATLGKETLGNVIVDEAGQATPQSIVGIVMRARKVLFLGDQRQLRPVVMTPPSLERHFSKNISPEFHDLVSPLLSSAQSLADYTAPLGTLIETGAHPVWLSLPLTIHRRCADPMFSLANRIAYRGFMKSVVSAVSPHTVLGESCWFHVEGAATQKQWVLEQGRYCTELVLKLLEGGIPLKDLFVITPFREVRTRATAQIVQSLRKTNYPQEVISEIRQRVGTIHTFQGREADIVILLLGCDASTARAADWAGEEPNLLNVAITRARKYLYVIGDTNVWHCRGYFSDLHKALPVRKLELVS